MNEMKINAPKGARLTKFIRLTVYSYLDLKVTALKAASLSKGERESLLKSEIARDCKVLNFCLSNFCRQRPAEHNKCIYDSDKFLRRLFCGKEPMVALTDSILIRLGDKVPACKTHRVGELIAMYICMLPSRFDR